MLLVAAWAQAADPRREATEAEQRGAYADAVTALRECVTTSNDRDRRYCAARLEVLGPQADDDFAGWAVLERVRSDRALTAERARQLVLAAYEADPQGPAARELARWLAHHHLREGGAPGPAVADADRAWLDEQTELKERKSRHQALGWAGLAVAAPYVGLALARAVRAARRGQLRLEATTGTGSFALVFVLLGVGPLVMATAFDRDNLGGFALSGAVATVCVLLAPRCHPALAASGTLGALTWVASVNGWLASMGVP